MRNVLANSDATEELIQHKYYHHCSQWWLLVILVAVESSSSWAQPVQQNVFIELHVNVKFSDDHCSKLSLGGDLAVQVLVQHLHDLQYIFNTTKSYQRTVLFYCLKMSPDCAVLALLWTICFSNLSDKDFCNSSSPIYWINIE